MNEQLTIDGGVNTVIFDGGNPPNGTIGSNFFVLASSDSNLTLNNLTLQNGYSAGAGGAILANGTGSFVNVIDSTFRDNTAGGTGGAIEAQGGVTITNSLFRNNRADGDGGAINHTSNTNILTVTSSAFIGNIAGRDAMDGDGSGGAIYHDGILTLSTITASYFANNRVENADSSDGGGAIYHNDGVLVVSASVFSNNIVNGDFPRGGAIYSSSTSVSSGQYNLFGVSLIPAGGLLVVNSHFGLLLGASIPAIDVEGVSVNGLLGLGNAVTGSSDPNSGGGAIYNDGYMGIFATSFIGNASSNHGGAIFNNASVTDDGTFDGDEVFIVNSTFANNTATSNGGAIYHARSDELLELFNLTIANNTAASGGGIFNAGDGESDLIGTPNDDVHITNSILSNNTNGNCDGGTIGIGNSSTLASGGNLVFGDPCDIRQQDGTSAFATPVTADPLLGTAIPIPTLLPSPSFTIALPLNNGSPASGTGDNDVCLAFPVLTLDQQNIPGTRPDGEPACDIGAYESSQTAPQEIEVRDNANVAVITIGDTVPIGTTPVGTPIPATFNINNVGGSTLTIGTITVSDTTHFSVTQVADDSLIANQVEPFTVTCLAVDGGTHIATVTIPNNDSDENSYTFDVECTVNGPEITVTGFMSNNVANGSAATVSNGTDFGTIPQSSPATQTFTIQNDGNLNLDVNSIAFLGAGTGFNLLLPMSPTLPTSIGSPFTFDVVCLATNDGIFTETITIANNDSNENPFTFDIRCEVTPTATGPQIEVFGNSTLINDGGGNSPLFINDTDFGALAVGNITTNTRTYTITNTGTVDLEISDIIVSGAGFSPDSVPTLPATIGAGDSITFNVVCDTSAPASHIGGVTINNNTADPTDVYTFNLACLVVELDVRVSKVANTDPVNAGSPLIYTVSIQNLSIPAVDVTNVVLTDDLPLGFTATNIVPSQGTCPGTPLTGTFNCNIGTVGPGNTATVVITGTFNPSTPDSTNASNEAYVNYTGFSTGSSGTDADGDDARAVEETVVVAVADVGVTKTVDNPTPVEGGTIIYTIEVENFGPSTATGVNLSDTLPPAGVSFDSLTGACSYIAPTVTCNIGTMLPGDVFTATITLTVDTGASALSPITNTANITSTSLDTNGSNDSSDVDINVGGLDLAIIKTVNNPTPVNGETIIYSITVNNPSLVTNATNIEITDNLPAGVTYDSDNSGSVLDSLGNATSYNDMTGIWTIGQLDGGATLTLEITATVDANASTLTQPITNTATLTAVDQTDINNGNDSSDADITVGAPTPIIEVRGNGNLITYLSPPDINNHTDFGITPVNVDVVRTFTIENIGNGTLTINSVAINPSSGTPFSIISLPATPINLLQNQTADFQVECDATNIGLFDNVFIEINHTDGSATNPFRFEIVCDVSPNVPEMRVFGNNNPINNGSTTPTTVNDTDFGTTTVGIPLERTFTIRNLGALTLNITTPITVPSGFTVITQPANSVPSNGSTTFTVQCNHAIFGPPHTGTVSIENNDISRDPYTFDIRCVATTETSADLSLSKTVSDNAPLENQTITYFISVSNEGPGSTTNVTVRDYLPGAVSLVAGSAQTSQGTFDEGTLIWDVGTMAVQTTETLQFDVIVDNLPSSDTINYAQVMTSSALDINSQPGNGIPPIVAQDDEARVAFIFDPPFGRKSFVFDGVNVLEWTIVWVNPTYDTIAVEMNDPLLGGTTLVPGSLNCTVFGSSTEIDCEHIIATNTIFFSGTIAPNPGVTPATANTASNRLVIVYRVQVPEGVATVPNTATLTDLDSDVTVTATETFTRTITPPPTGGGTPPLTTEEINAKVTALPATGETPWWADMLRIGLLTGVALIGAGAMWRTWRRRLA